MAITSPLDLTGLVAWWDVPTSSFTYFSGVLAQTMSDLSGNARHMTGVHGGSGDAASRTGTINGLAILDFTNVNHNMYWRNAGAYAITDGTVTFVYIGMNSTTSSNVRNLSCADSVSGQADWQSASGCVAVGEGASSWPCAYRSATGNLAHPAGFAANGAIHCVISRFDGSVHRMYVDGVETSTTAVTSTGNFNFDHVAINALSSSGGSFGSICKVGEVFIVDHAVDSTEITDITAYFTGRWTAGSSIYSTPTIHGQGAALQRSYSW
jgi:hypothetical protein